jgi:glyceraldehyde 3-phosphate dehydrogenase
VRREEINAAFAEASVDGSYRGVLPSTVEPLVSADIVGDPASCIVSAADTIAFGRTVKVLGWYDNEWGYATASPNWPSGCSDGQTVSASPPQECSVAR